MIANSGKTRILFVCLGNICRSPLAEGVFRTMLQDSGKDSRFMVDSAGTGAWHVGQPPDHRMQQTALGHEVDLSSIRARQFGSKDLSDFDVIFAMDKQNQADMMRHATSDEQRSKIMLFRSFDPVLNPGRSMLEENRVDEGGMPTPGEMGVPDPYYGGPEGFEEVFSIVSRTCSEIVRRYSD